MNWNAFLTAFLHGLTTTDDELRALADVARMCLATLQERSLLMRSPQLLGYIGRAWLRGGEEKSRALPGFVRDLAVAWDDTAFGPHGARMPPFAQAFFDLALDALQFAVLDRAVALDAIMEPDRSIRPLIVENVRRFIYDCQRGHDPSGNRLYHNLVRALERCHAEGSLSTVPPSGRTPRPLDLTWTATAAPGRDMVSLDEAEVRERILADAQWFNIGESVRTEAAGAIPTLAALVLRVVKVGEGVRGRTLLKALDALSRPLREARRDPNGVEIVRVVDELGVVELVPVAPPSAEDELTPETVVQSLARMLAGERDAHRAGVLRAVIAHLHETRELPSVDKLLVRMRKDGTLDCARTRLSVTLRGILDDLRDDLSGSR